MELKEQIDESIQAMQKHARSTGVDTSLIPHLKRLRPHFIDTEEADPVVTKLLRMSYEHVEDEGSFKLVILEEEESPVEQFDYLMQLFARRDHPMNRQEMQYVKQLFLHYPERPEPEPEEDETEEGEEETVHIK